MKLTTLFFAAAFGAGLAFVSPSADAVDPLGGALNYAQNSLSE